MSTKISTKGGFSRALRLLQGLAADGKKPLHKVTQTLKIASTLCEYSKARFNSRQAFFDSHLRSASRNTRYLWKARHSLTHQLSDYIKKVRAYRKLYKATVARHKAVFNKL